MTARRSSVPLAGGGLLVDLSSPLKSNFDSFDRWYGSNFVDAQFAALPDGINARRYHDVELDGSAMTLYSTSTAHDVADVRLLASDPRLSGSDRAMVEQLARSEFRSYELIARHDAAGAERADAQPAPVLLAIWWEPRPGGEAELMAWYEREHVPSLLGVPGWRRIWRYRRVGAAGPQFLALHELEEEAALSTPQHRAAVDTEWRSRVIAQRVIYERRLFHFISEH